MATVIHKYYIISLHRPEIEGSKQSKLFLTTITRQNTSVFSAPGIFPGLTATFELERLFGLFLLQNYFPTKLVVFLAYISFWINMNSVPARTSLGVTTICSCQGLRRPFQRCTIQQGYISGWRCAYCLFSFRSWSTPSSTRSGFAQKRKQGREKEGIQKDETVKVCHS